MSNEAITIILNRNKVLVIGIGFFTLNFHCHEI